MFGTKTDALAFAKSAKTAPAISSQLYAFVRFDQACPLGGPPRTVTFERAFTAAGPNAFAALSTELHCGQHTL